MNKPKLLDYVKEIKLANEVTIHAIDFAEYAFALEKYVRELEKQIEDVKLK